MQDKTNETIHSAQVVALKCPQYSERPQIGRVLSVDGQNVNLLWFDGAWTTQWKEYKYKVGKKICTWEEQVSLNDIIMTNIKLTKTMRLTSDTKNKLQELYDK